MKMRLTRRGVLLGGAASGLVSATIGLGWLRGAAVGYSVLSSGEVEIVEAISRVLFPPGIFSVHGGDGFTAKEVDRLLVSGFDVGTVNAFRYLLRAVQMGTLVSRARKFTGLSNEEAREVLAVWASDEPTPRRLASDSLKVVIGTAFFRRPEVIAEVGWGVPCLEAK